MTCLKKKKTWKNTTKTLKKKMQKHRKNNNNWKAKAAKAKEELGEVLGPHVFETEIPLPPRPWSQLKSALGDFFFLLRVLFLFFLMRLFLVFFGVFLGVFLFTRALLFRFFKRFF